MLPTTDFASVTGSLLYFGFVRPLQPADRNGTRFEELLQKRFKIPFNTWNAAEKIQTERAVLRKRMTREVRFGEKAKPGNATGSGKLMPLRFANGTELHFADDAVKQVFQNSRVAQRLCGTPERLDDPFRSAHGK
jgi:hypothetical protein